jgi:hypothetical protein
MSAVTGQTASELAETQEAAPGSAEAEELSPVSVTIPDEADGPVSSSPTEAGPAPSDSSTLRSRSQRRAPRPGLRAVTGKTVPRLPILLVVILSLVIGGLIDRSGRPTSSGTVGLLTAATASVAAAPDALSSSWFCGGATDKAGSDAPGQLLVTNAGAQALPGRVTFLPSTGSQVSVRIVVPARGQLAVPESVPHGAAWIGAFVALEGGQASVEQQILSPIGASSTPCATTGSNAWYFTSGATLINESVELTLLNPYPADAIADLSFTTDQGVEQTNDFEGLAVPARGMLTVDLGSHLRRRQRIATTVRVRTGRVVAWETDIVTPPVSGEATIGSPAAASSPDPAAPIGGVTDTLGSPGAGASWSWPEGDTGSGLAESYTIYNPGTATAKVSLTVGLDEGVARPFTLTVGPQSVSTVVSSDEARIPAGVGHFARLQSTNGVPVVAARTLAAGPPSSLSGLGELPGMPGAASSWLLASGALTSEPASSGTPATSTPATSTPATSTPATSTPAAKTHAFEMEEYVVVENPGTTPATVSIDTLAGTPIPGLAAVKVTAGGRTSVQLTKYAPANPAVVVHATEPVTVERDLYGQSGSPGVSLSPGVPLIP